MSNTTKFQLAAVLALVALFGFLTFANGVDKEQRLASDWLPDDGLRWGLDLQGGIHWVVGVDIDEAVKLELEHLADNLDQILEDEQKPKPASTRVEAGRLVVTAATSDSVEALKKAASETNVLDLEAEEGTRLEYSLTGDWLTEVRERTMLQVLEVLRRRIDDPERGIPDSVITRQGEDRVLVQIPGGQIDRGRARELLKSTGFLEFKIVEASADSEEALLGGLKGGLPEGKEVAFEFDPETDRPIRAYLVPAAPDLTGDYLDDARVGFDQQQRPIVNFTFNPEGGIKFGELTGANINQGLAIILDDRVYSAPIIRSQIGSRGQISGRFSSQEAADLAVVLRAGSLSVPVVIEEERSIGPALGQDSIDRGTYACVVGLLLVMSFAMVYYRLSGVYASLALLANLMLLVGLMSLFEATLTLPGIAGLVLTVGMAVDANVIIFERIREELKSGKMPRAAVASGFNKATWTVLDANLTTLFTALVLFEFGTGPIKGFAVTLSIGIVTSVFTALVLTRLLFQTWPGNRPVQELSI